MLEHKFYPDGQIKFDNPFDLLIKGFNHRFDRLEQMICTLTTGAAQPNSLTPLKLRMPMRNDLKFYMKIWVFIPDHYTKFEEDEDLSFFMIWQIPNDVGQCLRRDDGWNWVWDDVCIWGSVGDEEEEEPIRTYDYDANSFTIDGGNFGCRRETFKKLFLLADSKELFNGDPKDNVRQALNKVATPLKNQKDKPDDR